MPQYRKKPAPAKKEEVLDRSAAALMIEEILDEFPNTEQSVKERSSAALQFDSIDHEEGEICKAYGAKSKPRTRSRPAINLLDCSEHEASPLPPSKPRCHSDPPPSSKKVVIKKVLKPSEANKIFDENKRRLDLLARQVKANQLQNEYQLTIT